MGNGLLGDRVPKRIISRIDVKNGRVVKGIMMEGVNPVGDPIILSHKYYEQGIDEIYELILNNRIKDINDPRYSNQNFLKEHGVS